MNTIPRLVLEIPADLEGFFRTDIPVILSKLTGDEKANWGIMTVHHMLEHLVLPLKFVTREVNPPLFTPIERLERMHTFLLSDYALSQNFKIPLLPEESTVPLETPDIYEAREKLLSKINEFLDIVLEENFTPIQHPIFGMLNSREWLLFQYKHFHHHLSQFGLLSAN